MMNSVYRDRFALTLAHQPVDRCPIDLGGTPQATIEDEQAIRRLAAFLGFTGDPPADFDRFDRRILEHFDIDFRRVGNNVKFDTGRYCGVSDTELINDYGIRYRLIGSYWEMVESPLNGATMDDMGNYAFPTLDQMQPGSIEDWEQRAKFLFEQTPYVVAAEHPVFGVLELACWLCGYDYLLMMMALDPEFVHLLFDKILEVQKFVIHEYYGRLGRYIHLTTSGDDFGTQRGLFMSPQMWREFVKPYMKERIEYTAKFTDAVYMHHSCGAIFDIIPDLIEIGVGILNPIQTTAAGMDPVGLKQAYGKDIVFHGGLDTQEVLPSNDFRKIDKAVEELLAIMNPKSDGGYIFAPAHNLQSDVSSAAIARMYHAVLAFHT